MSRLSFAEFCLDTSSGALTRAGRAIPLEHQPSLVLARLAQSAGAVVTRDELASALWGTDTHVKFDDGLNYCIRQARAALGDDAKAPRFIETIPRRGYRFVAKVSEPAPARTRFSRPLLAAAAAAVVLLTVFVESRPNDHHELAVSIARTIHDALF